MPCTSYMQGICIFTNNPGSYSPLLIPFYPHFTAIHNEYLCPVCQVAQAGDKKTQRSNSTYRLDKRLLCMRAI